MERPELVHFIALKDKNDIRIKASLTRSKNNLFFGPRSPSFRAESSINYPFKNIHLLFSKKTFLLKIVGHSNQKKAIFKKVLESDSFGGLNIKISSDEDIEYLQVYDISTNPGIEHLVGSFLPLKLKEPKKIIISDFDKTLVDTRYSTAKEVYQSLSRPLNFFPKVEKSINILREHINKGFQPFILTASPHFYESSIRDWLYQNDIYTAGIFLKDYRNLFSIFDGYLVPKDMKTQGFYKLNHLIDIISLTGIPDELVLMGDGFEADPVIYLAFTKLMKRELLPWHLWNTLKSEEDFKLTNRQNSLFLSKIYKLDEIIKMKGFSPKVSIFIRHSKEKLSKQIPSFLNEQKSILQTYQA